MSELDLAAIETRFAAATPGPWVPLDLSDKDFDSNNQAGWWWVWQQSKLPNFGGVLDLRGQGDGAVGQAEITDGDDGHQEKLDAVFISHAREDVPALVSRVRELEQQIADVSQAASVIHAHRFDVDRRDDPEHTAWLATFGEKPATRPDMFYAGVEFAVKRIRAAIVGDLP